MNAIKTFGLVILVAAAVLVYSSIFTVDERENVLVVRFGEIQRNVQDPGLYFKLPIFEDLVRVEDRMLFVESTDKAVQVIDGRRYSVDAITMLRIVNPRRFRETVNASLLMARDRIETRLDAALRQTYGRRTFSAALSEDRTAMMHEIRDQVRGEAESLGIQIVDVRIRRTELMPDVLKDTYDRMNAERFAEAAELRAIGQAQAVRVRAEAERAAVELVATARRESEIVRGEGEADRNRLFADAFQRDPEFFSFWRSMRAYARSLPDTETTLVLKPDSKFFSHFGMQGSREGDADAPQQVQAPAPEQFQAAEPGQSEAAEPEQSRAAEPEMVIEQAPQAMQQSAPRESAPQQQ